MPRFETEDRSAVSAIDWRGWVVLAWVLWFGLLYGKMVVESRSHRVRDLLPHQRSSP